MLRIPAGVSFAELHLERQPSGRLLYMVDPLASCCEANEFDVGKFLGDEDLARWLITEWYLAHQAAGGAPDPIAEQILAK